MKYTRYICLTLVSGLLAVAAVAQQNAPKPKTKSGRTAAPVAQAVATPRPETPAPVALAGPEYLTGEAEVTAQGNRNPIIRLGLARNGATVVEFPASDFFFAVHPGSGSIVTVDESPTLATDHYLVFRAGPDFAAPLPETQRPAAPQAAVSVQMQSGLFVTFLFYPAPGVAQMAHRCVVRYSRAEVVATRKAAGLAVNLDESATETALAPAPASRSITAQPTPVVVALSAANGSAATPLEAAPSLSLVELPAAPAPRRQHRPAPPVTAAQEALRASLAAPNKFTAWSQPAQGLALAALPPTQLNEKQWLTVVAVRNTSAQGLRLIAPPALEAVTLDERGNTALTQSLALLHTATTSPGGAVPAGATIYYALVYDAPILGARQRLRVTAAHTTAADEPAAAQIPQ